MHAFHKSAIAIATATAIVKPSPSLSVQRQLVWDETYEFCDAAKLLNAQQMIDITMFSCYEGYIQWDTDSILMVDRNFYQGWSMTYPYYYPIFDSNKECLSFFPCTFNDYGSGYVSGQYGYDCSNVYCGPNAIRDCATGESRTVPCTDGLVSSPEIPSFELVECQQNRLAGLDGYGLGLLQGLVCSECAPVDDNGDGSVISYSCASPSIGCYEGDIIDCLTDVSYSSSFFPYGRSTTLCVTLGSVGNFCFTSDVYGLLFDINESIFDYQSSSCTAELNGASCSCSICGVGWNPYTSFPLKIVDCSTDDISLAFDECSGTSSGLYASYLIGNSDPNKNSSANLASFDYVFSAMVFAWLLNLMNDL